jgi:hypothetical protein
VEASWYVAMSQSMHFLVEKLLQHDVDSW